MKSENVLIENPKGNYDGFLLQAIFEYIEIPMGWDSLKVLKRIPRKVSYFLDKDKIKEVRRTTYKNQLENVYFVKLLDDTFLELIY